MANTSAIDAAVQIFTLDVVRRLYANNEWLKESIDHSANAVGKTVNVPNMGTVKSIINRTSASLTAVASGDALQSYSIDEYQTVPTKLDFSEELLTSYDNRQEILFNHEESFKSTFAERIIYNWTPNATIFTTGATKNAVHGTGTRKKATKGDIDRLNTVLTKQNVPLAGRCLLISADVHQDLLSIAEFISFDYIKEGAPAQQGLVGMISGFKVYVRSRTILKEIATDGAEGDHSPLRWIVDNTATERTIGATATDCILAFHPRFVSTALNSNTLISIIPVHGGHEISLTAVGGGSKLSASGIGVACLCEKVVS